MLDCDPNQAVGPIEGAEFSLQEINVRPGDTIFLYTDGLTEAKIKDEEEIGHERAEAMLKECIQRQLNPEEIVNTVIEEVHRLTNGAPQSDDLTMLAIRYMPK